MSNSPRHWLVLTELADRHSLLRFAPDAPEPPLRPRPRAGFVSVSRSADELSVICPTVMVQERWASGATGRSDGWCCLRVEGASLPDETPGIIASVVEPLAGAGLSVFAVATFDTDHVLVNDIGAASSALSTAGHTVVRHSGDGSASAAGDGPMASRIGFRPATVGDASDLALLADAATRRLVSWLWEGRTVAGQSNFEIGRSSILSDEKDLSHYSRWRVAEDSGSVVGGLNSYELLESDLPPTAEAGPVLHPLVELKTIAAGTWYVSVASVFPECRGQGAGKAILAEADRLAFEAGIDQVSLIVAGFNPRAKQLYEAVGYRESARRRFGPFPGSDPGGDWILMVKDVDRS